MYINKIDELISNIIDDFFNTVILKNKIFPKIIKEENFVKFQLEINQILANYSNSLNITEIKKVVNNDENVVKILSIIKRYLAYYLFLTIGYYRSKGKETFISNIIEFTKNQGTFNFKIDNFFNSENNSILINFYNIIKNTLLIFELDKNKLEIIKKKSEFRPTFEFLASQSDEIINSFKLENVGGKEDVRAHNMIKTIIFLELYSKTEKKDVHEILMNIEKEKGEYTFIDIVLPSEIQIDSTAIDEILDENEVKNGYTTIIYQILENNSKLKTDVIIPETKIKTLIKKKLIYPVVDDFLLYHKDTEKYEKYGDYFDPNKKKEDTKIRYIINKLDSVSDYYSKSSSKSEKSRKNTEKHFYIPLANKKAVLVNDIEEIKIINKLHNQGKKSIENNEFYNDLLLMRRYPFVNFKDFKDYGFTLQVDKTIPLVRYVNFENVHNKNNLLQTRVGSKNHFIDIVGVVINNSGIPLNCLRVKKINDIRKQTKDNNGYKSLLNFFRKNLEKNNKKPLFWKFDPKTDSALFSNYQQLNKLNNSESIKVMLSKLYDDLLNIIYSNILTTLESFKRKISIYDAKLFAKKYQQKFFNIPTNNNLYDILNKNIYYDLCEKIEKKYDKKEDKYGGLFEGTIKLPVYKKNNNDNRNIISIEQDFIDNDNDDTEISDIEKFNALCQHFISWDNLMASRKKNPNKYTDMLYDFINQYVLENNEGEYVCKSCGTLLNIKKYITDGFYDRKTDSFLTFTMPLIVNLEEIPEYEKYRIAIRNIDKQVEKLCSISSITYYIGSMSSIKSRRKPIVKNVIDLLIIHNKIMNKYYRIRSEKVQQKYGIMRNLTNLFIFPLENSIFIYSSKDKDFHKPIKQNNILVYCMIMLINELSNSQVIYMNNDKTCNFHWFDKYGHYYFDNLKIIINDKGDTENIKKYPVLCYILFYMACLITKYNLWYIELKDNTLSKKQIIPITHRSIINTYVDILNSILEVNRKKDKDYIYKLICNKFFIQSNSLFKDKQILRQFRNLDKEKLSTVIHSKKFIMTKVKGIPIPDIFTIPKFQTKHFDKYTFRKHYLPPLDHQPDRHIKFNSFTNCLEGTFHEWKNKKGNLVCFKCGKTLDKIKNDKSELNVISKNIRKFGLIALSEKYCISGNYHKFVYNLNKEQNICSLCGYYDGKTYTDSEYNKMEENIQKQRESHINMIKPKIEFIRQNPTNVVELKKLVEKGGLDKIINKFMELVHENLGKKIVINDESILLNKNSYIINHTPKGMLLEQEIIITDQSKIMFRKQHPFFKRDVIYYTNTKNIKTDVFYDATSHILLGYKESSKQFVTISNTSRYLVTIESIKHRVKMLGYTNKFIPIKKQIDDIKEKYPTLDDKKVLKEVIADINRNRISILKKTITDFQRYIYRLIYNYEEPEHEPENAEEPTKYNFMTKYHKKLNKIKLKDNNGKNKVFSRWKDFNKSLFYEIPKNIPLNYDINDRSINFEELMDFDPNGNTILYYILSELINLIEYNPSKFMRVSLVNFIIDTINSIYTYYNTDLLFRKHDIRRFTFLLQTDRFIYDTAEQFMFSQSEGFYGELGGDDEPDEEEVEARYDDAEEMEAMDVDRNIDEGYDEDEEEMMINPDNFE